jgi:hypothetical protein
VSFDPFVNSDLDRPRTPGSINDEEQNNESAGRKTTFQVWAIQLVVGVVGTLRLRERGHQHL